MNPTNTIDKLRIILAKYKDWVLETPVDTFKYTDEQAEQAIIAWALEAVPKKDNRKHAIKGVDEGIQIGYNQAIDDFRAKFTGGTE